MVAGRLIARPLLYRAGCDNAHVTTTGLTRRRVATINAVLTIVTLVGAVVLLGYGTKGADIATVIALVATVLISLWGWFLKSPDSSREAMLTAATALAREVQQEASTALRRGLADDADARAAEIRFRRPRAETDAELVRWRHDGGRASGSLSDIERYYESLERGRLVVLGPPGSGKTILAYHLTLHLARKFLESSEQGPRRKVPVWASLPSWDPGD